MDRILRTGVLYDNEPRSSGDGRDGVSGTGSEGEEFVEDFLRSRGIKGGMTGLFCFAISTARCLPDSGDCLDAIVAFIDAV